MDPYRSNVELRRAAEMLLGARSVAVTAHAKPDGDAFGSVAALVRSLRGHGVQARGLLMPPVNPNFAEFEAADGVETPADDEPWDLDRDDLVVVADTGAWSQLRPRRPELEGAVDRMLVLDHHLVGDVPAKRLIDSSAAACCELIADLLDEVAAMRGVSPPWDAAVAEAMFAGIASDTGWFRFSNTRAKTHRLAARLLEAGIDQSRLYALLEQSDRVEKLALMSRSLQSLRLVAGGRAAVMVLRRRDFLETGSDPSETDRLVDLPQSAGPVELVAMVSEAPAPTSDAEASGADAGGAGETEIRLSLRSKPTSEAVNVAALAGRFGGGGHARAAGAKVQEPLEAFLPRLTDAIREAFETAEAAG